jgi:hypothetical protein
MYRYYNKQRNLFCFLFHFQYFHLNEFPVKKLLNTFVFLSPQRFLKEHGTGIPIVGGDFNETLMPIDRKSKCKNGTFIQPVAVECMVTGLILHVSTREQKSVPINIISIRLACVLSFRRQVNCCLS